MEVPHGDDHLKKCIRKEPTIKGHHNIWYNILNDYCQTSGIKNWCTSKMLTFMKVMLEGKSRKN